MSPTARRGLPQARGSPYNAAGQGQSVAPVQGVAEAAVMGGWRAQANAVGLRPGRAGLSAWRRRWPLGALLVAWWLVTMLAGCGLHPGEDTLAFVRAGNLWTIQPDGSNAHQIATGSVAGFAWSPDHHELVFRTVSAGQIQLPASPAVASPDALGDLYITTINGNAPLQISQNATALARSDAWWDATGNRLLYRQYYPGPNGTHGSLMYVESQADQPLGIASKTLLDTASIPALAPDGSRGASIDADDNLRVGAPGQDGAIVARGVPAKLPGTGRPARVLWQPKHDALLYATPGAADPNSVALVLRELGGTAHTLFPVSSLLDVSFSPDGTRLLVRTTQDFAVVSLTNLSAPLYSWSDDDPGAVAFWSPDGRYVLVADANGMRLASVGARKVTPLLTYATQHSQAEPATTGLWHPATGSLWKADASGIVFAATSGDIWGTQQLSRAHSATRTGAQPGLYIGAIGGDGTPGAATQIDGASDAMPSWSYVDPSAAFLVPS